MTYPSMFDKKDYMKKHLKKKVVKKRLPIKKQEAGVMAIIPYSEIAKPEVYKGKYTLIPTPFTEMQIKAIIAPTPQQIIRQRPGKGGGQWDYVPGWWFKKKLNFVFGFSHDFDVISERVDGNFITVKGKITIRHPKTGQIMASKTDFGGAAIKFKKDMARKPENYLDISNDFKAATTDCFKRCAVQLGFAMDVYGKSESVEEGYKVESQSEVIKDVPRSAKKVELTAPVNNHLIQVKARLAKLGAKNEREALKILKEKTGLIWKDFKHVAPVMAQRALASLLNNK